MSEREINPGCPLFQEGEDVTKKHGCPLFQEGEDVTKKHKEIKYSGSFSYITSLQLIYLGGYIPKGFSLDPRAKRDVARLVKDYNKECREGGCFPQEAAGSLLEMERIKRARKNSNRKDRR